MTKFKGEYKLPTGELMVLDYNALCELEDITSRGAFELINEMDSGSIKVSTMRAIFYVSLKRHQPNITLEEAGDLLSDNNNALGELFSSAFGEPEGDGEEKNVKQSAKKRT